MCIVLLIFFSSFFIIYKRTSLFKVRNNLLSSGIFAHSHFLLFLHILGGGACKFKFVLHSPCSWPEPCPTGPSPPRTWRRTPPPAPPPVKPARRGGWPGCPLVPFPPRMSGNCKKRFQRTWILKHCEQLKKNYSKEKRNTIVIQLYRVFPETGSPSYLCTVEWIGEIVLIKRV